MVFVCSGGSLVPINNPDDPHANAAFLVATARHRPVAVFKPSAGELDGLRSGCPAGLGGHREAAAYALDQMQPATLRAGVPPTALVNLRRGPSSDWQLGSLQQFVPNLGGSDGFGPSMFDASGAV